MGEREFGGLEPASCGPVLFFALVVILYFGVGGDQDERKATDLKRDDCSTNRLLCMEPLSSKLRLLTSYV